MLVNVTILVRQTFLRTFYGVYALVLLQVEVWKFISYEGQIKLTVLLIAQQDNEKLIAKEKDAAIVAIPSESLSMKKDFVSG